MVVLYFNQYISNLKNIEGIQEQQICSAVFDMIPVLVWLKEHRRLFLAVGLKWLWNYVSFKVHGHIKNVLMM